MKVDGARLIMIFDEGGQGSRFAVQSGTESTHFT